ncbi:type III-B CRISPR module-associated protein Cmr5 [Palaeococcus sp. (in: euryarchaeotes)]
MRILTQERAKYAYKAVMEVSSEKNPEVPEKYSSYVKSAPIMVLNNGLSNTLAFYLSKIGLSEDIDYERVNEKISTLNSPSKKAYACLYYHISKWLAKEANNGKGLTNGKDPLKFLMEDADSLQVMNLTRETIALLDWIRRFAAAILKEEGVNENR